MKDLLIKMHVVCFMQANWGDSEGNFFNIGWVVKTLEQCNGTVSVTDKSQTQNQNNLATLPPKL